MGVITIVRSIMESQVLNLSWHNQNSPKLNSLPLPKGKIMTCLKVRFVNRYLIDLSQGECAASRLGRTKNVFFLGFDVL